jgi:predicted acyltransferase
MPPSAEPGAQRLLSVDALRGFDMLWITGGAGLVAALAATTDASVFRWLESQCHHAEWHGFTLWDLVFPLFLFLAGVSTPLSFARRTAAGATRGQLARGALRRALVLVLLGVVYNGLLRLDFAALRYASVLGRIGLAWLLAALAFLYLPPKGQALLAAALLLGYWALLALVPVPGIGAGHLEPGATLTDWLDRALLPGRLHRGVRDPEGLLGTLPAAADALLGIFAGRLLLSEPSPRRRVLRLAGAGAVAAAAGWVWSKAFPLNKNLWTSSFALWAGGLSLLLLAGAHLLFDVLALRRLAFPFAVVGRNALLAYMLEAFVAFDAVAEVVFARAEARVHPGLLPLGGLALRWLLLFFLYRRRWFWSV